MASTSTVSWWRSSSPAGCRVAAVIDIPFCVAGGIRSVNDAEEVLNKGADKISINTPALERRGAYRSSEKEAIETVKRAPSQPEAWLRIATVRSILRDEPEDILPPWRMSVFTGRTHSTLLAPRVGVALPYLEFMDDETRAMLGDQLLLAWALKPTELSRELKARDPRLERTRALVGKTAPGVLSDMEERLEKTR